MTNKTILSVEREHRLKIHRKPFLDLESGAKTCEIRDCSDRDFQVGDSVLLMLVDETGNPTPNELRRKITHIQTGYGLQDHLCVLSYEPADQHQGEPVQWQRMSKMHSAGKWWPCANREEADAAARCGWQVRPLFTSPASARHTMRSVTEAFLAAKDAHLTGTSNFCAFMATHLNRETENL